MQEKWVSQENVRTSALGQLTMGYEREIGLLVNIVLKLRGPRGDISVPKRQNGLLLIFGKIELGAFSESLRPPLSIAGPIMTLAGL